VPAADLPTIVPTLTDTEIESAIGDGFGAMPPQDLDQRDIEDCTAWVRATFDP
jgi:hypothetical protein